jgi:TrmH family RNA methyltransferase
MTVIGSRDNPRVKRWRALAADARLRRREKRALLEGEHLVAAAVEAGAAIETLILAESAAARFAPLLRRGAPAPVLLADRIFASAVEVESPAGIAAEIVIPAARTALGAVPRCVFLEGIQDAGNVGAILRSAAAFGIAHAVLGKGCADAWSPKVLRAAMGAHFSMEIRDRAGLAEAMESFGGRVACTAARGGTALGKADLSGRLGWLFGAEGRGVSAALAAKAALKVTIPMPGAAESLNVAAAAAICFYEASTRGARS